MKTTNNLAIVWLRRDLRLQDNTALAEASRSSNNIAVVFVFDKQILNEIKTPTDPRISFIFETITELNSELEKKGSQLIVQYGDPTRVIPSLVKKLGANSLYFNEDYELYAKKRDKEIDSILTKSGVTVQSFKDHVIFSGHDILKPNGQPYQMFTPYKKAWLKKLRARDIENKKSTYKFLDKKFASKYSKNISLDDLGFKHVHQYYSFQQPGRKAGKKSLSNFSKGLKRYHENRDFPYLNSGTSGLSVHLRFGTISVRECVRLSKTSKSEGSQTWLSELIWRDFYSMILDQYPYVEKECFKRQYNSIKWSRSSKLFHAWCEGMTGFPIIDAGMRQLNQTGWMHNRVRMITASFLTKDLLLNWKKGEAYFAEKLLDFDLASNNGGWQWCASTGCDAQPYFRIFNPSLQSKRFDPEGIYIRTWVPELKDCTSKDIHDPENSELNKKAHYPKPIITHSEQKQKILEIYKKL